MVNPSRNKERIRVPLDVRGNLGISRQRLELSSPEGGCKGVRQCEDFLALLNPRHVIKVPGGFDW